MVVRSRPAARPAALPWIARLALLVAILLPALPLLGGGRAATAQEAAELGVNSKAYIVVDADTGEVFAQRDADERRAMASLTKVFTAVEAIEAAPPDLVLTTEEADLQPAEASIMGLSPGETYTVRDLLYGLMLPSGNDAAWALARGLSYAPGETPGRAGDDRAAADRFVARMNARIADMGLANTRLKNPDGWGVPGHYSTAADLAAFVRYALQYPRFVELISAADYTMSTTGAYVTNNNRLLNSYPDLLGGKTGYDWDAGWCLIEVAERDGMRMVSVTLDGIHEGGDWYDDNQVLLEYAFDQKAARAGAGPAPQARVLSYLDPDAAVIARSATAGGSLGGAPPPPPAAVNAAPAGQEPQSGGRAAGASAGGPGVSTSQLLAVAAAAALILLSRGFGAFHQPRVRAARAGARPGRADTETSSSDQAPAARNRLRPPLRRVRLNLPGGRSS